MTETPSPAGISVGDIGISIIRTWDLGFPRLEPLLCLLTTSRSARGAVLQLTGHHEPLRLGTVAGSHPETWNYSLAGGTEMVCLHIA